MNQDSIFLDPAEDPKSLYAIIKNSTNPKAIEVKKSLDKLWGWYSPFADALFKKEFQRDFHARFWEMYLTCTLLKNKYTVDERTNGISKRPDISISYDGLPIWIEAVTPSSGAEKNPDRLIDTLEGSNIGEVIFEDLPEEQIILRYRSAIEDKYKKYAEYLKDGIINAKDCYIIAVNNSKFPKQLPDSDPPLIVKSVFPIGHPSLKIDAKSGMLMESGYTLRGFVKKSTGIEITTNIFLDSRYSSLSGILFSNTDAVNCPDKPGSEFILVHNPLAINKLPKGFFSFGKEYVAVKHDSGWDIEMTNYQFG